MSRIAGARTTAAAIAAWAFGLAPVRAAEGPVEASDAESGAGLFVGGDLRAEASGLFKSYTQSSGRTAWVGGPAGGVEASVSLHFRPPSGADDAFSWDAGGAANAANSANALRWIDFELGLATAQRYVSYAGGSGQRTSFFENDTAIIAAAHVAWGHLTSDDPRRWSGAIVGLAWTPTAVFFFGNGQFTTGGRFNPAGVPAMVDLGSVADHGLGHPLFRISLTWLPFVGDLPSEVVAGAGVVFY